MLIVKFNLQMNPKNSGEILNAVQIISQGVRTEEGCLDYYVFRSFDDENELIIIESWKTMTQLRKHWKTMNFGALLGIQSLLSHPIKVEINKVAKTLGLKEIEKVRTVKKAARNENGLKVKKPMITRNLRKD